MDLTRLGTGEKIAGIAGIALILIMFAFDWFGANFAGVSGVVTTNAWGSYGFTDVVLFITALAAVGLAYLAATRQTVSLPVAASAIVTALGILSVILILVSIISPPDLGFTGPAVDHTRKAGVWLGLIAAGVVTYGGYLAMQEEGTTLGGEADRLRRGSRGGPGAPPPPSSGRGTGTGGPPPPSG
jgi:hypothetical protein